MADMRGKVNRKSPSRVKDGVFQDWRVMPDGAGIMVPWMQVLVLEGKVYGFNAGTITTPIAGHAAIDADQPEMAVRVPSTGEILPLSAFVSIETGSTTLGAHGAMVAVSNIDVANGTSSAANADATTALMNMNFGFALGTITTCRHTYSGNGTDPLTAGNFQELARVQALLDSDAATSGFHVPPLRWSYMTDPSPVVRGNSGASFLAYWEGSASAMAYGRLVWADFDKGDLT